MLFFLDTADIDEIKTGLDWGMVDGVTTNPSLIAKQGKPYLPTVKEIAELVPGPVSGEVLATDYEGMLDQGRRLADLYRWGETSDGWVENSTANLQPGTFFPISQGEASSNECIVNPGSC